MTPAHLAWRRPELSRARGWPRWSPCAGAGSGRSDSDRGPRGSSPHWPVAPGPCLSVPPSAQGYVFHRLLRAAVPGFGPQPDVVEVIVLAERAHDFAADQRAQTYRRCPPPAGRTGWPSPGRSPPATRACGWRAWNPRQPVRDAAARRSMICSAYFVSWSRSGPSKLNWRSELRRRRCPMLEISCTAERTSGNCAMTRRTMPMAWNCDHRAFAQAVSRQTRPVQAGGSKSSRP